MRSILCFIFCLFIGRLAVHAADSTTVELSTLHFLDSSSKKYTFLSTARDSVDWRKIPFLPFQSRAWSGRSPSDALIERDCYVRFVLHNGDDTAREVYFTPGYYLKRFTLYSANPDNVEGTLTVEPDKVDDKQLYSGCKLIHLAAGQTRVYFAKFNFLRTNINIYDPYTIEKSMLWSWLMLNKTRLGYLNTITYVACGILLLMIFYSLAAYAQNRQREFLFYSGYVFCTGIMLFLKSFLDFTTSRFNLFFEEYLDIITICVGVFFYLGFIRTFLNTGQREPFLEKMLRYAGVIFLLLIAVFSLVYFLTDRYVILNVLENYVIKMLILAMGVIVVVYSFRKKDTLLNYLAAGNIALIVFSFLSLCILLFKLSFVPRKSLFNRSLFYYEIGIVCEMGLFLFGLAYKNKEDIIAQVKERERYKLEAERKEFEKQMAMMAVRQEERDRISADMHDDLGSGVTAIRLMSEIVKSKMNTDQYPEIDKISNSANELLGKMNSIIWTMKSSNDTLESLVAYLRAYATEYFDGTPVDCTVQVSEITEREMSGEKRRSIFLSFKETLNNILKHAQATEVRIRMHSDDQRVYITIHDNGVGIDLKNVRRFGNGLNNIKKRMQSINGDFIIGRDNGTLVCLEIGLDSD